MNLLFGGEKLNPEHKKIEGHDHFYGIYIYIYIYIYIERERERERGLRSKGELHSLDMISVLKTGKYE